MNDGIDPRVIVAEHGWWFPEIKDEGHGWDISNVNILTDNAYETLDPAIGATNLRVCLCSIAPVCGFVVEWKNPMKAIRRAQLDRPRNGAGMAA